MKKPGYFKKSVWIGCTTLASIFLFSMGFDHHKLHPLKPVETHVLPALVLDEAKVEIAASVMNGEESKKAFGHDLPSRGIYPLAISIQNNTGQTYSLSASSVDLPRVEASSVAFKITKSAIPRAIAYKVASFFFWPFAIPSTIDGIRVFAHNKQIKKDMRTKSMNDGVLAPYSTLNRVVFVKEDQFNPDFKVTLIDLENLEPVEFHVHADPLK